MSPILQSKERKKEEEDSLTRRENRYKSKTKKKEKTLIFTTHVQEGSIVDVHRLNDY